MNAHSPGSCKVEAGGEECIVHNASAAADSLMETALGIWLGLVKREEFK